MTVDQLIVTGIQAAAWVLLLSVLINAIPALAARYNDQPKITRQAIVILVAIVGSLFAWLVDCSWSYNYQACPSVTWQHMAVTFGVAYVLATTFDVGSGELIQSVGERVARWIRNKLKDK